MSPYKMPPPPPLPDISSFHFFKSFLSYSSTKKDYSFFLIYLAIKRVEEAGRRTKEHNVGLRNLQAWCSLYIIGEQRQGT